MALLQACVRVAGLAMVEAVDSSVSTLPNLQIRETTPEFFRTISVGTYAWLA
jgi:hypothetical protein